MTFQQQATAPGDRSWSAWDDNTGQWHSGKHGESIQLIGKIIVHGEEHPCVVHDMTNTGMVADVFRPIVVDDRVWVEVESLPLTEAVVVACSGQSHTGISVTLEFIVSQSEAQMAARNARTGFTFRAPRFSLIEPARLRIGHRLFQARTLDISEAGAKIDVSNTIALAEAKQMFIDGTLALLNIRGMHQPRLGQVKWSSTERLGFKFQSRLTSGEIVDILRADGVSRQLARLPGRNGDTGTPF